MSTSIDSNAIERPGSCATLSSVDVDPTQEREPAFAALLEPRELEVLLLNFDASLTVSTSRQFYIWAQGLLQGLVPHRALFCLRPGAEPTAYVLDTFSALASDATELGALLIRDPVLTPNLIEAWKGAGHVPAIRDADQLPQLGGSALARALQRVGATRVAVHGTHDADGEMTSLFIFASARSDVALNQSYLLRLIVPFLSAAWIRSQVRERAPGATRGACAPVLTAREREVLHWIYLGKGNAEVGAILRISALTVKNHVQKILRKLNVANRAQAVGKALEARLIGP